MHKKAVSIEYVEFADLEEMDAETVALIQAAIAISKKSYSPYSKFPVGAAVLLDDGQVFAGNNQENIAFPSGTCAERSVLNYVHGNFPERRIQRIAITAPNSNSPVPVTPCGFCRQVMVEIEQRQGEHLQVILHKIGGPTYVFDSAVSLLPLAFEDDALKKQ